MALSKEAEAMWREALAELKRTPQGALYHYVMRHPNTHTTGEELVRAGVFTVTAADLYELTPRGKRGP